MTFHVLLVEDDHTIRSVLQDALQTDGHRVTTAADGDEATAVLRGSTFDLLILDVMLPGPSGLEILQALRRADQDTPVLLLTARSSEGDKVLGLELGADDYVTKPFNHLELMARVRAVLRRHDMPAPASRAPSFRSGDLEVDFARQEARLRGEHLDLTPIEYKLLYHLVRNAGHVLQHGTLLAKVWGREYVDEVDYLRVYVRRLREKLGDHSEEPRYIRTERGLGYRFLAPATAHATDDHAASGESPDPAVR
jgi:two-component system KDP operon response regulator KdpE